MIREKIVESGLLLNIMYLVYIQTLQLQALFSHCRCGPWCQGRLYKARLQGVWLRNWITMSICLNYFYASIINESTPLWREWEIRVNSFKSIVFFFSWDSYEEFLIALDFCLK